MTINIYDLIDRRNDPRTEQGKANIQTHGFKTVERQRLENAITYFKARRDALARQPSPEGANAMGSHIWSDTGFVGDDFHKLTLNEEYIRRHKIEILDTLIKMYEDQLEERKSRDDLPRPLSHTSPIVTKLWPENPPMFEDWRERNWELLLASLGAQGACLAEDFFEDYCNDYEDGDEDAENELQERLDNVKEFESAIENAIGYISYGDDDDLESMVIDTGPIHGRIEELERELSDLDDRDAAQKAYDDLHGTPEFDIASYLYRTVRSTDLNEFLKVAWPSIPTSLRSYLRNTEVIDELIREANDGQEYPEDYKQEAVTPAS